MNRSVKTGNGALYAAFAYILWGFSPLYWKLIKDVPAIEVATHRVVWSAPTLLAVIISAGRYAELRTLVRKPKILAICAVSALLIAINWYVFIYSVAAGYLVEISIGYYLCPLITVLLASIILKEKLRQFQLIAIALAAVGVLFKMIQTGHFPWLAVLIATTFAFYSLVRKKMQVEALMGLAVETLLLSVPALIAVFYWQINGTGAFFHIDRTHDALIFLSGAVTMLPLLLYSVAVRTAPLSLVGFLQYIGPTIQLLFAVFLFNEPFELSTLWSLLIIWAGLVLFVWDSYRQPVIETCL